MFQVRIHRRGGQGVVTAAELLSVAAFLECKHAQAFPSFGSERTGAPVVSFCRIDLSKRTSGGTIDKALACQKGKCFVSSGEGVFLSPHFLFKDLTQYQE
jgi:Pyruvate/2-oxoacid:ferredoxin oxidoreductase gamma subunit